VGTVIGGQYKVLSSPVVPEGKMILVLKPDDERAAVYYYCPYQPITVYPWPMQNTPSMTFMTRYGKALVRPQGIAILNITT